MKSKKTILPLVLLWGSIVFLMSAQLAVAQQKNPPKAKMIFLGEFDAGQPDAGIYKLYDPTDEVLCYILMPTNSTRKQVEPGKWAYESNTLGSISCLKVQAQKQPEKKQK
jgi:hypothetical protein